jgi:aspartate aminotransferase-like enzyme
VIYKDVPEGLKYVFQTKNEVYTVASSGTGAMEIAVTNLLSPGDKIIVASCGNFGDRWIKIAEEYGAKVISVSVEWEKVVNPVEIKKALEASSNIKAVYTTFTETSTGVVNDIKTVSEVVSKTNAVLVVDTISGLAGQEFKTDDWNSRRSDIRFSKRIYTCSRTCIYTFITLSDKA